MDRNFNRAVTATLKYEGGWSNHPSDPGGATNLGVTIATFRRYVKPSGTIADLKALTVDQAKTVYRRQYWDAVSGAELPDGVLITGAAAGSRFRVRQSEFLNLQYGISGTANANTQQSLNDFVNVTTQTN